MPKIVDHARRRDELAGAMLNVVVRRGLEGTTIREVAAEAGYSTGVLQHYFADKKELLVAALRLCHRQVSDRLPEAIKDKTPLESLRAYAFLTLPLDERTRRETHLDMSYWSHALVDEDLAEVQRKTFRRWRDQLEVLIDRAQEGGELSPGSASKRADTLLCLTLGLSVENMLDSQFTGAHILELFDDQIACWRSPIVESLPSQTGRGQRRGRQHSA
ncbi:transcriptional regulator [Gordonia terrae]|uniref:Transcriptional regulator n=1 Tax=Gordonia terrae TaxID=2055 RepID=A0A2I1R145_9ACTN|nr:TetR/AcrR family transcriptional regulator [Gordonia terrae]PKZ62853.1 transcriptional regulator [Gordonia terrae]